MSTVQSESTSREMVAGDLIDVRQPADLLWLLGEAVLTQSRFHCGEAMDTWRNGKWVDGAGLFGEGTLVRCRFWHCLKCGHREEQRL